MRHGDPYPQAKCRGWPDPSKRPGRSICWKQIEEKADCRAALRLWPVSQKTYHAVGIQHAERSSESPRPDCLEGIGAMTMSCDDAGTDRVERFEVFTGAGLRRHWPPEEKASILTESFSRQETVCSVAPRHGMSPSQLIAWRRLLPKQLESQGATVPALVPAVVDVVTVDELAPAIQRPKKRQRSKASEVVPPSWTVWRLS